MQLVRFKPLLLKHRIALIATLVTLLICSQLVTFYNSTELDIIRVSTAYLGLAYALFVVLLVINYALPKQTDFYRVFTQIPLLQTAIASVIGICLLMTLERVTQHRLLYNAGAILAYALLLFFIVRFVNKRMPGASERMGVRQHNFYFGYAIFLLILFLMGSTMEQSDPYGPRFQLRIVFWLLLLHLLASWIMNLWKVNQQLRNEQQATELMHLKSQINPHFFFNTLNNLYGLAREKADAAPELILRLSDMMRYTIYQGQQEKVPLQQEVDYLNNYIELQQIRFKKSVHVTFDCDIEDGAAIAPLLFINLVENAYKHGVETLAADAFIHIRLQANDRELEFAIENNRDPGAACNSGGIGLTNLRKRLTLLYPDAHQLQIKQTVDCYSICLHLTLAN